MGKFSETLDRKAEEIQRPPLLPIGNYIGKCIKPFSVVDMEFTRDGEKVQAERIEFQCAIVAAEEVDEDDLAEYGNVANVPFRVDFLRDVEENANQARTDFQIRSFLEAAGALEDGMSLEEGLANIVGCEFGVEISHRPDKNNPDVFYLNVAKTYGLDD